MDDSPEIRSYRAVFALERRIYRIDTVRLNPSGIPLRGIVYAAALVAASLVGGSLPPLRWLDPLIPWYVRDAGLPLAAAWLLASARIDGRAFHLAALAAVAHLVAPRRLSRLGAASGGDRWQPPPVLCIADGSDARLRALRYRGPGAVLVRAPHRRRAAHPMRRASVTLHPAGAPAARASVLELAPGAVLEVRVR